MDKSRFEDYEDNFQAQFDNIGLLPRPLITLVSITLLKFRDVSVSFVQDLFMNPNPRFSITCPKVAHESVRTFYSTNIDTNVTSGDINETFHFVVPSTIKEDEDFPVIFELHDMILRGVLKKLIGEQTFDAATLTLDGEPLHKTFVFGNEQGELDVVIRKVQRSSPDFRYSLGLHQEEKKFRKKRIPIVQEAVKNVIGEEKGPKTSLETPVVSLVCSGGGYRAVTGMCGAMEALKDAGLLDTITYSCGLSGSAWYLSTAYALKGVKAEEQESFHNGIRTRFEKNLPSYIVESATGQEYLTYLRRSCLKSGPHTLVNWFGFIVGKQLLGEKIEVKLSELIPYVEDAQVPYPLFVALHVKNNAPAYKFHAYMERSPHEIYFPSYGVGVDLKHEGSSWNEGFVVRPRQEYPLHFTIGMVGCAFAIYAKSYLVGGEYGRKLADFIDSQKQKGKKDTGDDLEISSEEEDEELEDEILQQRTVYQSESITAEAVTPSSTDDTPNATTSKVLSEKEKETRNLWILSSRSIVGISRTAEIYNFALGMDRVKRYSLNPLGVTTPLTGETRRLIDTLGCDCVQKKISTKKSAIDIVDAGFFKNVPTDAVLRPQRTTDIMIVMDFNAYGSDDHFDYTPLLAAAAHAWQSGLKFPNIDFKTITNLPPQDFLAFPSDSEGCPTVLWFTLSNKKFRKVENYVPKSKEQAPDDKMFNDFDVFGDKSFCGSTTFQYDNYRFDQLRELMYFNVSNHIEEIKEALIQAIQRKRERLSKET